MRHRWAGPTDRHNHTSGSMGRRFLFQHGVEFRRKQRPEIQQAAELAGSARERMVNDQQVELLGQILDRLNAEIAKASTLPMNLDPWIGRGKRSRISCKRLVAAWMIPSDTTKSYRHVSSLPGFVAPVPRRIPPRHRCRCGRCASDPDWRRRECCPKTRYWSDGTGHGT